MLAFVNKHSTPKKRAAVSSTSIDPDLDVDEVLQLAQVRPRLLSKHARSCELARARAFLELTKLLPVANDETDGAYRETVH